MHIDCLLQSVCTKLSIEHLTTCDSASFQNSFELYVLGTKVGSIFSADIHFIADINGCSDKALNDCHRKAKCTNTEGSYSCECKGSYEGDGFSCTSPEEPECTLKCGENQHCDFDAENHMECVCDDGMIQKFDHKGKLICEGMFFCFSILSNNPYHIFMICTPVRRTHIHACLG